jgi:hypothetical protein
MAEIIKFLRLRGYTYEGKNGILKVYTPDGERPPSRRVIFALLREARKKLLEDGQ